MPSVKFLKFINVLIWSPILILLELSLKSHEQIENAKHLHKYADTFSSTVNFLSWRSPVHFYTFTNTQKF